MMNDHLINCDIHYGGDCSCGFDPTLPIDEDKVMGAVFAMIFIGCVIGIPYLLFFAWSF